jgi:ferredoxin
MREGMSGPNYRSRMLFLFLAHVYIVLHLVCWYLLDLQIWGKTAMMGVPSLMRGNFNAAAIMVLLIMLSAPFLGRRFCGWICHMRGAMELADWMMRKLGVQKYLRLKKNNTLINTRYRWLFRLGLLFVLLLPVIIYITNHGVSVQLNLLSPPPYADLPGYENRLFAARAPLNMDANIFTSGAIHQSDPTKPAPVFNPLHLAYALGLGIFIVFVMSFVLSLYYGHGAFCRILCPYVWILVPLMNLSPWQRKITRADQCRGCRGCSNSCPQGIDVSREIWHFKGKVINRECIKCYACIDACEYGVLKDSAEPAVSQFAPRKEYIRRPWIDEENKHLQVGDGVGPVHDFLSMIFALGCGWATSLFGGFFFYIGAVFGFIAYRQTVLAAMNLTRMIKARTDDGDTPVV